MSDHDTATTPAAPAAPEQVRIFDTTMRDGEQSPGASMTLEEKLEIARLLDHMGVDIIEAGFPAASQGDFESVRAIAGVIDNAIVCGLARAAPGDIDRAGDAIKGARQGRIHTFLSTSPVHMKHKLQMAPDAVLAAVTGSVARARNLIDDVQWSPEDATRTDHDFLCRCVEAAVTAGATTINIPDTVGYTVPEEFAALFAMLRNRVPNMDRARLSVHCHNDLGMAVANSLAGVVAGARQVECTINGMGERAGNASLEEIVMAFRVRSDRLPFRTDIKTEMLLRASRLVSGVTGFPVQYNKAIVGRNAFAHESGIHQDGMLKNNQTYEIMLPETVGFAQSSLVMGKHSGRHAFREKLAGMGYTLGDNAFLDAFTRFKALADRKKHVFDDDIAALVDDELGRSYDRIRVVSLRVTAGTEGPQEAAIELELDGGARKKATSTGDGPVDAVFRAIGAIVPHTAELRLYQVSAVTEGSDAQAEVSVRLEDTTNNGRTAVGRGADTDTLVASARAYVGALSRLTARPTKAAPGGGAAE